MCGACMRGLSSAAQPYLVHKPYRMPLFLDPVAVLVLSSRRLLQLQPAASFLLDKPANAPDHSHILLPRSVKVLLA